MAKCCNKNYRRSQEMVSRFAMEQNYALGTSLAFSKYGSALAKF